MDRNGNAFISIIERASRCVRIDCYCVWKIRNNQVIARNDQNNDWNVWNVRKNFRNST